MLLEVLSDVRADVLVLDYISTGREFIEETFVTALCEPRTPPPNSLSLNIQPRCGEDLDGVALLVSYASIPKITLLVFLLFTCCRRRLCASRSHSN